MGGENKCSPWYRSIQPYFQNIQNLIPVIPEGWPYDDLYCKTVDIYIYSYSHTEQWLLTAGSKATVKLPAKITHRHF